MHSTLRVTEEGEGHLADLYPPLCQQLPQAKEFKLPKEKRFNWGRKRNFIGSLFSFTFGIAILWRFPYCAYVCGGGAFIFAYITILLGVGLGLYLIEASLGQGLGVSYIRAWQVVRAKLVGLGISALLMGFVGAVICGTVTAWSLYYLVASFSLQSFPDVPWHTDSGYVFPTRMYLFEEVLRKSENLYDLNLKNWNWKLVLCLFAVWMLTAVFCTFPRMIKRGWGVVMGCGVAIFLPMIIRLCMCNGAGTGVMKLFEISSGKKLLDAVTWVQAASQVFLSLGIGTGALVNWCSFVNSDNGVLKDATLFITLNILVSLLSGLVVFMAIGVMSYDARLDFWHVALAGPASTHLAFSAMLTRMPFSAIWSIAFWAIFVFIGLYSLAASVELLVQPLTESQIINPRHHTKVCAGVCCFMAVSGLIYTTPTGIYNVKVVDTFAGSFSMLAIVTMELFASLRWYGLIQIFTKWGLLPGKRKTAFVLITVSFITPIAVISLAAASFTLLTLVSFGSNSATQSILRSVGGITLMDMPLELVDDHIELNEAVRQIDLPGCYGGVDPDIVCGGRGTCIGHICECDRGFGGILCQDENSNPFNFSCPLDCGGNGFCMHETGICYCYDSWVGMGCQLERVFEHGWSVKCLLMGWGTALFVSAPLVIPFCSRRVTRKLKRRINLAKRLKGIRRRRSSAFNVTEFKLDSTLSSSSDGSHDEGEVILRPVAGPFGPENFAVEEPESCIIAPHQDEVFIELPKKTESIY